MNTVEKVDKIRERILALKFRRVSLAAALSVRGDMGELWKENSETTRLAQLAHIELGSVERRIDGWNQHLRRLVA